MNWLYLDGTEMSDISQFPENTFGFIYRITHIPSSKIYIGKKVLYHNRKTKLGKKALTEFTGPGRKPKYKTVIKESDWKTYYGSSKPLLELLKKDGEDKFKREILILASDKKMLTYYETKTLFMENVLENPDKFFNDNILGKFFSSDFQK